MSSTDTSEPRPLDEGVVTALAHEIMLAMREHYLHRPVSRATAQEVLNALAIGAAVVILAARECGDEHGAREFFDLALEQQIADGGLPTDLGALIKATEKSDA